jgi:ribosomal protein S13
MASHKRRVIAHKKRQKAVRHRYHRRYRGVRHRLNKPIRKVRTRTHRKRTVTTKTHRKRLATKAHRKTAKRSKPKPLVSHGLAPISMSTYMSMF